MASWISCWCLLVRRTRICALPMTPAPVPQTTPTCPISRLWLSVFRPPVSLWCLDVRAAAWSGSTAETGTDELTAGERRDLSKNETTGFDGKGEKQHEGFPGQSGRCDGSSKRHWTCAGRKERARGDEGRAGRCRGECPQAG